MGKRNLYFDKIFILKHIEVGAILRWIRIRRFQLFISLPHCVHLAGLNIALSANRSRMPIRVTYCITIRVLNLWLPPNSSTTK